MKTTYAEDGRILKPGEILDTVLPWPGEPNGVKVSFENTSDLPIWVQFEIGVTSEWPKSATRQTKPLAIPVESVG